MLSRNVTGLVIRRPVTRLTVHRTSGKTAPGIRRLTNSAPNQQSQVPSNEGWLFVDSVFPIRLGIWDLRHYIGIFREESLLAQLDSRLSEVKTYGFKVVSVEPYPKDGGVFVKFTFNAGDQETVLKEIEDDVRAEAVKHGGMPSWAGLGWGDVWLVKGRPWPEDMNRYPSPVVKVYFEGPDVQEETLYELFRPYGRISNLTKPHPVPGSPLRAAEISFARVRSGSIARNVFHGFQFTDGGKSTRFQLLYQQAIQAHAIRDWLTSHPRIVLPILFFLLGTLTYTIFDPIRVLSVEAKLMDWFDYREYDVYKWLQAYARSRLLSLSNTEEATQSAWKERKDAENALRSYLMDPPSTVAFVHGPQGSGKHHMISEVLRELDRKDLVIDCAELNKAPSDSRLVAALAQQTGYRPVFTFLNSLTNVIDIASIGVIGQKAGLGSSLPDQLKQILEVVGSALIHVNQDLQKKTKRSLKAQRDAESLRSDEVRTAERIREGIWHDGRLDCVAGNGIMSELGIGDEALSLAESDVKVVGDGVYLMEELKKEKQIEDALVRKEMSVEESETVAALPVVVISHYGARGSVYREDIQKVLSQWVATLVENQIAHVIVVSDNRETSKFLNRALPSKPLNTIPLDDADAGSALEFVKQRLCDAGLAAELTNPQVAAIQRLGGRASDLQILIHKARSGQDIEEAVEDIISRGVGELRKNAFGEDIEDAKSLQWTREQAWTVLKQLAQKPELPYYDILSNFPFKGDEVALRTMEHAELISVGTANGRPSTIRPGKPVFKYVFERLVNDPVFRATQDLAVNNKLIAGAESIIQACEAELVTLKDISGPEQWWFQSLWASKRALTERKRYLSKKMYEAQVKVQALEKQNVELRRTLAKGT